MTDDLRDALGWHQPVSEYDDSTTFVCGRCGLSWPCDATQALAALSAPAGLDVKAVRMIEKAFRVRVELAWPSSRGLYVAVQTPTELWRRLGDD